MTEYIGYGELQQLWRSLGNLPENLLSIYVAEIALALGKCIRVIVITDFG